MQSLNILLQFFFESVLNGNLDALLFNRARIILNIIFIRVFSGEKKDAILRDSLPLHLVGMFSGVYRSLCSSSFLDFVRLCEGNSRKHKITSIFFHNIKATFNNGEITNVLEIFSRNTRLSHPRKKHRKKL